MLLKGVLGRVEAELILNQFAAKEAWRARLQNTGRPRLLWTDQGAHILVENTASPSDTPLLVTVTLKYTRHQIPDVVRIYYLPLMRYLFSSS